MPVSRARAAAFDILLQVEKENAYASELLHSPQHTRLSTVDHGLATDLVMGVLRWRSLLDDDIAKHASLPVSRLDREVLTALRIGAYQLRFFDRVPARAAVNESVELTKHSRKRSAASLVNALLRKLSTEGNRPPDIRAATTQELARVSAHPAWLVDRWAENFGLEATRAICGYDQTVPATCIRLAGNGLEEDLEKQGISTEPGTLIASARRLKGGDVTKTEAFRDGRVSIQDEASQLVALIVGTGERILDCCAAPGGKTRILAERNPGAAITAVELHPHRARLLQRLVPAANVEVVTADIRKFKAAHLYDRVLVDAPCSGTGTLARNPEIKWTLRPEDLADLQKRQIEILRASLTHLAPGGRLIYSTCSLEPEENEVVVSAALSHDQSCHLLDCRTALDSLRNSGELVVQDVNTLVQGEYLRTIPGIRACDGFFAAVLERIPQ